MPRSASRDFAQKKLVRETMPYLEDPKEKPWEIEPPMPELMAKSHVTRGAVKSINGIFAGIPVSPGPTYNVRRLSLQSIDCRPRGQKTWEATGTSFPPSDSECEEVGLQDNDEYEASEDREEPDHDQDQLDTSNFLRSGEDSGEPTARKPKRTQSVLAARQIREQIMHEEQIKRDALLSTAPLRHASHILDAESQRSSQSDGILFERGLTETSNVDDECMCPSKHGASLWSVLKCKIVLVEEFLSVADGNVHQEDLDNALLEVR